MSATSVCQRDRPLSIAKRTFADAVDHERGLFQFEDVAR